MLAITEKIMISPLRDNIFSEYDLDSLANGTSASRYGMVNKALKKKELIRLRRGLYVLSDNYRQAKFSKYFLASRIIPHSYVSLESAFSFHGWIPEKVISVYSVTSKRSSSFTTSMGEFIYFHIPTNELYFLDGVMRKISDDKPFLVATPLRALADYVYVKKIEWSGLDFLLDGLRIEIENLKQLESEEFEEIKNIYRSTRVINFFDKLKQALRYI